MSVKPNSEAVGQLLLRYQAATETAKLYSSRGFSVVYQDVVIGPLLKEVISMFEGYPLHVVVLCPSTESISKREAARDKTGYGEVSIEQLQKALNDTPRIGLWIDSSNQTVDETVEEISDGFLQARVFVE